MFPGNTLGWTQLFLWDGSSFVVYDVEIGDFLDHCDIYIYIVGRSWAGAVMVFWAVYMLSRRSHHDTDINTLIVGYRKG